MTERELSRAAARRLAIIRHAEEVTGNVALTCRYFGISRPKFYKWKKRFEELGAAGLADRPQTPHHSPNATPRAVISKGLASSLTEAGPRVRRSTMPRRDGSDSAWNTRSSSS